jgi:hypothetical protein
VINSSVEHSWIFLFIVIRVEAGIHVFQSLKLTPAFAGVTVVRDITNFEIGYSKSTSPLRSDCRSDAVLLHFVSDLSSGDADQARCFCLNPARLFECIEDARLLDVLDAGF